MTAQAINHPEIKNNDGTGRRYFRPYGNVAAPLFDHYWPMQTIKESSLMKKVESMIH